MKAKPKSRKRASRGRTKARPQLRRDPSERDAKDFIVAAIEASLTEALERLGFSRREVKGLLAGSTKALTAGVRQKLAVAR
jgi:hypothetical protein